MSLQSLFVKLKGKNLFKAKFPPDKRHPGHRSRYENTDNGPDMGFYGPLVNQSE
jgi:hypothetical protein